MDDLEQNKDTKEPIDEPIRLEESSGDTKVSHSPLDLGAGGTIKIPGLEVPDIKVSAQRAKPVTKKTTEKVISSERITGVRTFFTKLHAGAMEFLDEQISNWLKENPDVVVKRTNLTTGDVAAKKTEPNIIITVWY